VARLTAVKSIFVFKNNTKNKPKYTTRRPNVSSVGQTYYFKKNKMVVKCTGKCTAGQSYHAVKRSLQKALAVNSSVVLTVNSQTKSKKSQTMYFLCEFTVKTTEHTVASYESSDFT
jgi:hypothetical protein